MHDAKVLKLKAPAPANRRWIGGRVRVDRHGQDVFVIEAKRGMERYAITLDVGSESQALLQYALFDEDPVGYRARVRQEAVAGAGVVLDGAMLAAFLTAFGPAVGDKHRSDTKHYLLSWLEALNGRDMSAMTLRDYHVALESLAPYRHHVTALRSLTAWLRKTGRLARSKDATLDLEIPQTAKAKGKGKVGLAMADMELLYAALTSDVIAGGTRGKFYPPKETAQAVRDVLVLRALTGLHYSEIGRIACGARKVKPLVGGGEIAGTVEVFHKSQRDHLQPLVQQAFAAAVRLQATGSVPEETYVLRQMRKAAKKAGVTEAVRPGALRHSFVTWSLSDAREVVFKTKGVSRDTVKRAVGHTAVTTTNIYDESMPPLIVLPINLVNSEDP